MQILLMLCFITDNEMAQRQRVEISLQNLSASAKGTVIQGLSAEMVLENMLKNMKKVRECPFSLSILFTNRKSNFDKKNSCLIAVELS